MIRVQPRLITARRVAGFVLCA